MTVGRGGATTAPGVGPIMMTRIALTAMAVIMIGCVIGAAVWNVRYRENFLYNISKIATIKGRTNSSPMHQSGMKCQSDRYSQPELQSTKILVVGSAPYVPEWWSQHHEYFVTENFYIVAINNAWQVVGPATTEWIHSDNFLNKKTGTLFPSQEEEQELHRTTIIPPLFHEGYKSANRGTMAINVWHIFLSRWIKSGFRESDDKLLVVTVGTDFQYGEKCDHFYCKVEGQKGAPDPLKFGLEWLKEELAAVQRRYDEYDCKILNASEGPTLLPFEKFTEHLDHQPQNESTSAR